MIVLCFSVGSKGCLPGRGRILSDAQEIAIVDMHNNALKLQEIRDRVLADDITFGNVNTVSTTTIARVLEKHKIRIKHLYPLRETGNV